jgi:hypothetical protein
VKDVLYYHRPKLSTVADSSAVKQGRVKYLTAAVNIYPDRTYLTYEAMVMILIVKDVLLTGLSCQLLLATVCKGVLWCCVEEEEERKRRVGYLTAAVNLNSTRGNCVCLTLSEN